MPPIETQVDQYTRVFMQHADGGWSEHVVVSDANVDPLGYQQLDNLSTANSLTVPTGARIAIIQAEAHPIRYRDDGIAPTSTLGMLLETGESIKYSGNLSALQIIAHAGTPKVNISYYG